MEVDNIHFKSYKESQVGLIPSDWTVKSIGDIASFSGGSQPSLEYFSSIKRKDYIRLIQIRDYKTEKYTVYIPKKLGRKFCDETDVMIGRYGPPIFQILTGLSGAYNVALIKATPKDIEKKYLYYILKQDKLFKYIELLSQRSSGQTGVDLKGLKEYNIPFPTDIKEQKAIATALSDMDDLILSLEKLISKKKLIKEGAMEELLTGKKRLDGFDNEWYEKQLGEITVINMGQSPDSKNYNQKNYGLPLIQGNADIDNRKTIVRNYTSQITKIANEGDVIMTVRAPVGKVGVAKFDCCIGRGVCSIKCKNRFIYHYMIYLESSWANLSTGSTFDSVSSSEVAKVIINIPKDDKEQEAIAKILSDMDNEIEILERKLDKYKNIKSGMLEDLLTGKRRLV